MKKTVCMIALAGLFWSLAAASKTELQTVHIEYRYNTVTSDAKNTLRWTTDGTKKTDYFDVQTGASVSRATQSLSAISVASKNKVLPKALRALLLYAVSPRKTAEQDAFCFTQDGKKLTVQFVHRGVAYRIQSDENGMLDVEKSFFIADHVAENTGGVFTLVRSALPGGKPPRPEAEAAAEAEAETDALKAPEEADALKAPEEAQEVASLVTEKAEPPQGPAPDEKNAAASKPEPEAGDFVPPPYEGDATDMHNICWENIDFVPDTADEKAQQYYAGHLRISLKDGILRIRGTLSPKNRIKAEAEEAKQP